MKKLISLLLICLCMHGTAFSAVTLEDVKYFKNPFYRFGTNDLPENRIEMDLHSTIQPVVKKESFIGAGGNPTYADLSIKKMSVEISKIIEMDYNEMQSDLSLLWQGAATKSDTIKFAIYKLSNPDKDKPDNSAIKKVLTTIAGMSTLVGAGMGNPVLASAALIGGNTLGIMSQDTKALNYKYTQVNDADMIILVRKVEDL